MKLTLVILLFSIKILAQDMEKRCYTHEELTKITLKLIRLKELDTLYKSNEKIIFNQNSLLKNKDREIKDINRWIVQKDSILSNKDNELKDVSLHLKKAEKKLVWSRVGWAGSSLGFISLIVLILIHK